MIDRGTSAFKSPFELWREDGVLHLVLAPGAVMQMRDMKEVLRVIGALDPSGHAPVLLDYPDRFAVRAEAGELLRRVCGVHGHPVAFLTRDPLSRQQGERFLRLKRPAFPFRIFDDHAKAYVWARERMQFAEMMG